jgi:hypothetical protein
MKYSRNDGRIGHKGGTSVTKAEHPRHSLELVSIEGAVIHERLRLRIIRARLRTSSARRDAQIFTLPATTAALSRT